MKIWLRAALLLIALIVLLIAGAGVFLTTRAEGFSAREKPTRMEVAVAQLARSMSLPRDVQFETNPVPDSGEVEAEARAHWADHCAVCHSNDGSGDTEMGRGMYPPPPDMRQPGTQQKSDGALFYVIENGTRLSGMPAWGGAGHDPRDSWKLVRFVRHLPLLTAEEKKQMEKLNPKGPDELKEEEEEEKFLKGEESHEPVSKHHH
jgi:mono/diheme cytochrome c family protein